MIAILGVTERRPDAAGPTLPLSHGPEPPDEGYGFNALKQALEVIASRLGLPGEN